MSKTKWRAVLGVWGVTACQSGPLVPLGSSFVQIKDDKDNDDEEDEDKEDEDEEDKEDCQSGPLGSVGSSFVQIDILATLPFCWPTWWHMLKPNNPKFNIYTLQGVFLLHWFRLKSLKYKKVNLG